MDVEFCPKCGGNHRKDVPCPKKVSEFELLFIKKTNKENQEWN